MVELGGVSDSTELKFLVLYVLKICKEPIPPEALNDILLSDGLVDFFDFTTALNALLLSFHIHKIHVDEEECYAITPLGTEAIELFEKEISFVVREKVTSAAKGVLRQRHLNAQVRATYIKLPQNTYEITLELKENDNLIFSISLTAPNLDQVNTICRNFKKNPTEIFGQMIDILTTSK